MAARMLSLPVIMLSALGIRTMIAQKHRIHSSNFYRLVRSALCHAMISAYDAILSVLSWSLGPFYLACTSTPPTQASFASHKLLSSMIFACVQVSSLAALAAIASYGISSITGALLCVAMQH